MGLREAAEVIRGCRLDSNVGRERLPVYPWFASALSDGAKPGSLLLLRVTAADVSIFVGHAEAEVVERTATEDNGQVTVRVPAGMRGETPIYAVAAGELSNPVTVCVQ